MATREQNEREYRNWVVLPDGGRRYWRDRKGKISGSQRFVKLVDSDENTVLVVQEIYNDSGELVERHQKYPVDMGHEILGEQKEDD